MEMEKEDKKKRGWMLKNERGEGMTQEREANKKFNNKTNF